MKKLFLLLTLFFCIFKTEKTFTQTFTAKTGDLYLGDNDTDFSGSLDILSGVIKKNDKVDIYAETGRKFTATITKMTGDDRKEITQCKAGQYAYFDLKFTSNPSTGKDYLRKGYKVFPAGFQANTSAIKAETEATLAKSANLKVTLDGKSFRGTVTYKGASFWKKGVKNVIEKPYLQIQFRSVDSPDDRTLTIQIFNPKEVPTKYGASDLEVNFSGATDGVKEHTTLFGFVNGKADTPFTVEVSKWQKVSNTKAIISGKIYGDLKEIKILGKAKAINKFENGVFENVEVEVFNELYDLK
ncbi:hypothetical protein LV89_03329 [Arcicella aurantiaca]|uniref:Uncharacterized protein n=1 Tax=Arcicella aurantiaca TaxID=591202 RepID=A0A316DW75_9BACT|nr:hypothetical protein [Arcicella aurantiaca]PWK22617.1 hypothetical protein LV89_03329 [Arcicella aurantiaca]